MYRNRQALNINNDWRAGFRVSGTLDVLRQLSNFLRGPKFLGGFAGTGVMSYFVLRTCRPAGYQGLGDTAMRVSDILVALSVVLLLALRCSLLAVLRNRW